MIIYPRCLPLWLTFDFRAFNASAKESPRLPPPVGGGGELGPLPVLSLPPPGTIAALLSRRWLGSTFFKTPPPTPPEARIDAITSALSPADLGKGGAEDAAEM